MAPADRTLVVGVQGVLLVTQVQPAAHATTLREWYLSQPLLWGSASVAGGRLTARAMLDFEGAVMRRGELTPGIYGEGYIDRRHPHTVVHEVMLEVRQPVGRARFSLGAGKGFVPFGSDDPMMRPFQKFPVNHHVAQIIERAMLVGAGRWGPVALEGAVFNGDEPESPGDWPNFDRFADSWSARATFLPRHSLEATASVARVTSPEDAGGKGLDQRKVHWGFRFARPTSVLQYALVEYGKTDEYRSTRRVWTFSSTLVEAGGRTGPAHVAARFERTTRPDEERTGGDFRSLRPLLDFNILGRSRWDVVTLNLSVPRTFSSQLSVAPFVEAGIGTVRPTILPTTFVPAEFYGASRIWTISLGLRVNGGAMPMRMGRYGAAMSMTEH